MKHLLLVALVWGAAAACHAARPGTPTGLRVEALGWIGHAHTQLRDPERAFAAISLALEEAADDP